MRRNLTPRSRTMIAGIVAALGLVLTAGALAAHPKAGKTYSGFSSAAKVNGFSAPVSFKVSSNGTKLLGFQYGNGGCLPVQTVPPGNPYSKASGILKVGTIAVSANGSFSVQNAKFTYVKFTTTTTKSTVAGKFKTAKSATGTIRFTQHVTGPGGFNRTCGPVHLTFSATIK